jgi:hypothetical protein
MSLDKEIFQLTREYPPMISRSSFLTVLSLHGYNTNLADKALDLADLVHNHEEGHMYYSGGRGLFESDTVTLGGLILNDKEKIRGSLYSVGHLMPVTLCYLDHAMRNDVKPNNEELFAMILHDVLEDLHWNSPYFQRFKEKEISIDMVIENSLKSDVREITKNSFYIVDNLTKRHGQNLGGDVEKLQHLANISPELVNYKFADRLIGTRATMNKERRKDFLFDFPLRRAEFFLTFAKENPGVVWQTLVDEFEVEKETLIRRIK